MRVAFAEPKGKTINDRLEWLVTTRRKEDAKTGAASVILEERAEMNELLDELIIQREELLETRRKDRDEKTALDTSLDDAAKEVRRKATMRMSEQTEEG